jgi:hypothetical protein
MLASSIWWILIVSGVATGLGGLNAALVPGAFLRSNFGVAGAEPSSLFFARHWGVLVIAIAGLIVWSAYLPAVREPVLVAAAVEKCAFVALIIFGSLKRTLAMTAIAAMDGIFTILYVVYLTAG